MASADPLPDTIPDRSVAGTSDTADRRILLASTVGSVVLHVFVAAVLIAAPEWKMEEPDVVPVEVVLLTPPELEALEQPAEQEPDVPEPETEDPETEDPEADPAPEDSAEAQGPNAEDPAETDPPPPPPADEDTAEDEAEQEAEQEAAEAPSPPPPAEDAGDAAPTFLREVQEFAPEDEAPSQIAELRSGADGVADNGVISEVDEALPPDETIAAEPDGSANDSDAQEVADVQEAAEGPAEEPVDAPDDAALEDAGEDTEVTSTEEVAPETDTAAEESVADAVSPEDEADEAESAADAPTELDPESAPETVETALLAPVPLPRVKPAPPPLTVNRPQTAPDDLPPGVRLPSASRFDPQSARQGGGAPAQQQRRAGPRLGEVQELYSDRLLSDTRVRTAMAGMPTAQRLNLLCVTELRAQISSLYPNRPAEMLPSFRPSPSNVLEPARAAYRSRGEWYDLNFRCETDEAVTRVTRFSFRVGPPVPRAQWRARGFPDT